MEVKLDKVFKIGSWEEKEQYRTKTKEAISLTLGRLSASEFEAGL